MLQGAPLTESERPAEFSLHSEGKSARSIATTISRDVVLGVIRSGDVRVDGHRLGVYRKLPLRFVHFMLRTARAGSYTVCELQLGYAPVLNRYSMPTPI